LKILVAEDDAISHTILKKSVEKFGHGCLAPRTERRPGNSSRTQKRWTSS
jgi:hypothetical protein